MIVSFCASHMILQLEGDSKIIFWIIFIFLKIKFTDYINLEDEKKGKKIKVRFLQGPHQNQDWTFIPAEKKIVRIGRSKSAEIVYKDDSISRIQCT